MPTVTPDWPDLLEANDFALRRFVEWRNKGTVRDDQLKALEAFYERQRSRMVEFQNAGDAPPDDANLPFPEDGETGTAKSLRFLTFLCHEIRRHEEAKRLGISQAHALLSECRERMAALNRKLGQEQIQTVLPVQAAEPVPVTEPTAPAVPRRTILEILLDPRSLQWLVASGGVLLALGLVIWLAALHVFENRYVIAVAMGLATGLLLVGGWSTIWYTRYQFAGRALTLLACLVMPLNLWFYAYAQLPGLTFEPGSYLWIAGLVCCALYAASAWVLKDSMFVYVLTGGVAMTGLLILADMGKFYEVASPATLLVVMGLLCIHLEAGFPSDDSPFSRKRFGLAFFFSGQALLGAGLLFLMGTQILTRFLGIITEPWFQKWGRPAVVDQEWGKLLAIGLVIAGTYAYLYSDIVVRRLGLYIYLAAATLLWAELLIINQFDHVPEEIIIAVLAATALAINLAQASVGKDVTYTRTLPALGLLLSLVPVLYGIVLHLRATVPGYQQLWPYTPSWGYVGAMAVTVISCRVGAHLFRDSQRALSAMYFFATGAATLVGAAGLLSVLGYTAWADQAPVMMLIPIAYLAAARAYQGQRKATNLAGEEVVKVIETPWEAPLVWVAHLATAIMILCSLATLGWNEFFTAPQEYRLKFALFFGLTAVFYAIAAAIRRQGFNVHMATVTACAGILLLLQYADWPAEYGVLTFAALGLAILVGYRFAVLDNLKQPAVATAAFQAGNVLLGLSFAASAMLTLRELFEGRGSQVPGSLFALEGGLAVMALVAAGLVLQAGWRRFHLVMAVGQVVLAGITLNILLDLSIHRKAEIFAVTVGVLLLIVGHVGWYREQERQSDAVSFSLGFGALLAGVPLMIATIGDRWSWSEADRAAIDEFLLLTVAILLFLSGVMCQIRATTVIGGILLTAELLMLVLFGLWWSSPGIGIFLAIAGGGLFLTGVLLSVYRDRLLTMPERIKKREGVFRVLSWR